MKKDTAKTIFRTVVFAGAMLGTGACSKKQTTPSTVPANTSPTADPATGTGTGTDVPSTETASPEDPCAGVDPCAGGERPRGNDDGGGGAGRGFILS